MEHDFDPRRVGGSGVAKEMDRGGAGDGGRDRKYPCESLAGGPSLEEPPSPLSVQGAGLSKLDRSETTTAGGTPHAHTSWS